MKIIFLDVDGVLNHTQAFLETQECDPLVQECLDELGRIFTSVQPRPLVILSSTWRLFPADTAGRIKLEFELRKRGIFITDMTPDLAHTTHVRGEEIDAWLKKNTDGPVTFTILDDDSDFLEEQKPFHVHTSMKAGLTRELADRAIEILNNPLPS